MTTYNTGNPVPSSDARDRYDNSQTLDEVVNGDSASYTTRTGKQVISLGGMNSRFNNAQEGRAQEFTEAQAERHEEFDADQALRESAFEQFMNASGWSSLGDYAAGISIVSHSQTVDYLGQPYALKASVPASLNSPYVTAGDWSTESVNFKLVGDNSLRQDLGGPDGAKLIGNGLRSVYDSIRDLGLNVKDAPFNAVMDGISDDGPAFKMLFDYLKLNGGWGYVPHGTLYLKTYRPYANMADGDWLHGIRIFFDDVTIKYGNISPVLNAGGTAVITREPDLFSLLGDKVNLVPHPRCYFPGKVTSDYSEQVWRGGASAATPALTDIKPLSNGVRMFISDYGYGVELGDWHGNEIYGNGICLFRSAFNKLGRITAKNVSAGNIGLADSNGAFIIMLAGGQVGTHIQSAYAINERVYLTDTVGGFTDRSAKNTPCGYIGICAEYAIDSDGIVAPGTELWYPTSGPRSESFNCTVDASFMYGYFMGYKSETVSPIIITGSSAVACWMPFVTSGSVGVTRDCYADRAHLDDLVNPMTGYRYVQGMYSALDYTNNPVKSGGILFEGCRTKGKSIPVFSTNCHYSKFLNQQTLLACTGGTIPPIAVGRSGFLCKGTKVSGTVVITGAAIASVGAIGAFDGLEFDLDIVNETTARYLFRLEGSPGSSNETIGRIKTTGLVCVASVGSQRSVNLKHTAYLEDAALAFSGTGDSERFLFISGGSGGTIESNIVCHANAVSGPRGLGYVNGSGVTMDISATLPDVVGSVTAIISMQGVGNTVRRIKRIGAAGLPLIALVGAVPYLQVQQAVGADGPLFAGNAPGGPLEVSRLECLTLSATGTNDPNALANLSQTVPYIAGATFKHLRPVLGASAGPECMVSGRKATAWAATTAIALGNTRAAGGNVYTCTVAGTTGTVAPSHTSGSATDGTVTWAYLAPEAKFAAMANLGATYL